MSNGEVKRKIIIVDDDNFLVNMYAQKFGHNEIESLPYKSGTELLEKLRAGETADLILLDIVIPGLNGMETLEAIRKEKLAQGVPVVMLTNQSEEKDIQKASALGVAGYIVKASATPSEVVEQSIKIINDSKNKS